MTQWRQDNEIVHFPTIIIQNAPQRGVWDLANYAPAIPGVIVSILTLFLAHHLALKKEKRKEKLEMCENIKKIADDAVTAAIDAWNCVPGEDRRIKIFTTKQKFLMLGRSVTDIDKYSGHKINVVNDIVRLRRAATVDPFEDSERCAQPEMCDGIISALSDLISELDRQSRMHLK